MKNPRQKKTFAMVGSILLGVTTELVVIGYYWGNLSGWWRVLTVGLFFVAYVQLWASWWYVSEDEDRPVITTSFFTSLGLALVMAFNAGMILITRTDEAKAKATKAEAAKIEAEKLDQESRAKIAQIQAESDALAASKDWRTAREARLEREAKAKIEAEEKRRKELQEAAAPKPAETPAQGEDFKDFIDFAKWYCRVLVFLVPILAAIAGKFTLGFVISLPGGAEPGRPTSRTLPTGATPNPQPISPNPPAPNPPPSSPRATIPITGRGGPNGP